MAVSQAFQGHLNTGVTHVCRCWAILRRDGVEFGFTDHDLPLDFEGLTFSPSAGMTARAIEQTTGLSVDNTEAIGILSADVIAESDILAGRYDGAVVRAWFVNWSDVEQRSLQFKGTVGELQRAGGAFQAELRGLTEALNQPQGRVFQKPCSAVLGDNNCRFDLDLPGYVASVPVEFVRDGKFFDFEALDGFAARWFERGRFSIETGAAAGMVGLIKNDRETDAGRTIELWQTMTLPVEPGDMLRIEAGCDRRSETCKLKFNNYVNFQGFPDIPGEDWLMSVPRGDQANEGGSLRE